MHYWRSEARCDGMDTSIFYPEKTEPNYRQKLTDAKEFCRGAGDPCPVIHECLMYALLTDTKHGVWGGLSNRERRALWRKKTLPSWITREDLDYVRSLHERREQQPQLLPGDAEAAIVSARPA